MIINFSPQIKKLFGGIFAIVFIIVFVVMIIKNPAPEHIKDTNGANDYTLQTITEQNVINMDLGSRGAVQEQEKGVSIAGIGFSKGKKYSAKKFTGVFELYSCHLFSGSDVNIELADFKIKGGNFKFYVVFEDEIIGTVEPNTTAKFTFENVEKSGTLRYVIAGESAAFEFIAPIEWE